MIIVQLIRIELEKSLGANLLKKIYRLIYENVSLLFLFHNFQTSDNQYFYDIDNLADLIYKELKGLYDSITLENIIQKIPEVFSIVVKEREQMLLKQNLKIYVHIIGINT